MGLGTYIIFFLWSVFKNYNYFKFLLICLFSVRLEWNVEFQWIDTSWIGFKGVSMPEWRKLLNFDGNRAFLKFATIVFIIFIIGCTNLGASCTIRFHVCARHPKFFQLNSKTIIYIFSTSHSFTTSFNLFTKFAPMWWISKTS